MSDLNTYTICEIKVQQFFDYFRLKDCIIIETKDLRITGNYPGTHFQVKFCLGRLNQTVFDQVPELITCKACVKQCVSRLLFFHLGLDHRISRANLPVEGCAQLRRPF
jgi:hypothetical protein